MLAHAFREGAIGLSEVGFFVSALTRFLRLVASRCGKWAPIAEHMALCGAY